MLNISVACVCLQPMSLFRSSLLQTSCVIHGGVRCCVDSVGVYCRWSSIPNAPDIHIVVCSISCSWHPSQGWYLELTALGLLVHRRIRETKQNSVIYFGLWCDKPIYGLPSAAEARNIIVLTTVLIRHENVNTSQSWHPWSYNNESLHTRWSLCDKPVLANYVHYPPAGVYYCFYQRLCQSAIALPC